MTRFEKYKTKLADFKNSGAPWGGSTIQETVEGIFHVYPTDGLDSITHIANALCCCSPFLARQSTNTYLHRHVRNLDMLPAEESEMIYRFKGHRR